MNQERCNELILDKLNEINIKLNDLQSIYVLLNRVSKDKCKCKEN